MIEIILPITACATVLVLAALPILTTKTYRIATNKLTQPIRIVQIADLHSCRFGKNQSALRKAVENCSPDVICITGDHFDDRIEDNLPAKEIILALAEKYPIIFAEGNHELYCPHRSENLEFLRRHKVILLNGNQYHWQKNGQQVTFCGISDPVREDGNIHARKRAGNQKDHQPFAQRLSSAAQSPTGYMVLLSHRPERYREYSAHPFDLVLSGHAHGGQWRIPFLINGLFAPHQGWFPQRAGGMYRSENGQIHIVSRGLSKLLKIPRFFNPPELVCIDITGADAP